MSGMTVEEARTVELPLNPISRMAKCAELGGRFALRHVGLSPITANALTRHGLIRLAQHQEVAENMLAIADEIHQRTGEEEI